MQDEVSKLRARSEAVQAHIQFLISQEQHLAILISQNKTLEPTYSTKWLAIKDYVQSILNNKYQHYSTGIPTVEDCSIRVEITPRTVMEIAEGNNRPTYKWVLDGPDEETGAIHRRSFALTSEATYCSKYPDVMFCCWLAEKNYIKQYTVETN